ncbi:MAG TPA: enoyl-CoA hydratase-related protein [Candidatus Krumholzibacteria bacterium]|nr:enoyl-CoA hydratase-related protein [Candidatus Krumholzibacteria bacterium]HPD72631.1 enoyl-CoA hydratase-related protein [Candidatus Krumholzibacteria bacterium]HRY40437.1 enoyl-CoA hydratase-related protein [Candidatus Krumholzibacteria bacterium]
MQYEHFDCDIRDGAARVTLLGPGNPLLSEVCDEFVDLMLRLQEDQAVRAILVTDGDHAFDLQPDLDAASRKIGTDGSFAPIAAGLEIAERMVNVIQECSRPVVTATRGDIRATGLGFYMAGDVRLAGATASFTAPDLAVGLMPEWGLTFTLPRVLGPSRALEFLWSGRTLSAGEAYAAGLVDRVIADAHWDDELETILERLTRLPQPLIRLTKLAAQQSGQFDLTSMLSFEFEAQQQCWDSVETAECLDAWVQNRKPVFRAPLAPEDDE